MNDTSRELITDLDYSYVDQVVRNIRSSLSITEPSQPMMAGPLLSIHLQSNRPESFAQFMEELEASVDDPSRIEVVVKIDDVDKPMNELLPRLVAKHKITLKYISTPLVGGFFELWRSMNDMLQVCHPHAYFLWNMNDEMAVLNKGWDTALAKYVGLFPDHIFRLRTSLFRFRNYYDFWENGFAPETSAITTKRWIDICGDWNPCLGPDSFNQCVSYYFGYHDRFNKHKVLRDVPIHDILLAGEGAFIGLEGDALWRRLRGATKAWYRLMSHKIQNDASRRSQKLIAHIWAYQNKIIGFHIEDDRMRGRIRVYDKTGTVCKEFPYQLSYLKVTLANMWRTTGYFCYGGGGSAGQGKRFAGFCAFLALRYDNFEWIRQFYVMYRRNRNDVMPMLIMQFPAIFAPNFKTSRYKRQSFLHHVALVLKRLTQVVSDKISGRMPKEKSVHALDTLQRTIDWPAIYALLHAIQWPFFFTNHGKHMVLVRCMLLQHWYGLSDSALDTALKTDASFQRFACLAHNIMPPSIEMLQEYKALLKDAGVEYPIYEKADKAAKAADLPVPTALRQVA